MTHLSRACFVYALLLSFLISQVQADPLPLKVFVLAGQSNMQGSGAIQDAAEKFIYKHRPPSIDLFVTDLNLVP